MSSPVLVTDDGAIRTIRLNRPEKKNALTLAMYADMTAALHEANQTDTIRCVMFAGSPGAFCAGNDIGDFLAAALGGGLEFEGDRFHVRTGQEQKAARRRGRGRRHRDRHHYAVSLRSRRRRGRCDVLDSLSQTRAGSGISLNAARAHAHGSRARLFASGHGQTSHGRRSKRCRHRQHRRRQRRG